jgi:hypothetical protein
VLIDEWKKKAFDQERRQNGFFLQTIVEQLEIIEERNWRVDAGEKILLADRQANVISFTRKMYLFL